jgi:hypothetical protein
MSTFKDIPIHNHLGDASNLPADQMTANGLVDDDGHEHPPHSIADTRIINNVMRHEYRILTDEEKHQMSLVKDLGLDLHNVLTNMGDSRCLSVAKTKIEEAVMWAVKHITE